MKFLFIATLFEGWTDKLALSFTGILALVGIVGIIVAIYTLKIIVRQTKATETAAEATEKSVKLQEVAMRQWVSIENWNGQIVTRQGERILEFTFDIVNRTKSPLKLEFVMTNAFGSSGSTQRADHVLGPEKEFKVKRVSGPLSDKQYLSYCESSSP